jgi:L-threonylcarbamoyladenylate synthase
MSLGGGRVRRDGLADSFARVDRPSMSDRPARPLVLTANPLDPIGFARAIAAGAAWLAAGRLVAFPTETVYGLGANALDANAVRAIFAAKGRPSFNPLIVHVPDVSWLGRVARDLPPLVAPLAAAFWPGPLTLLVPRRDIVPDEVTAGLGTVGVRVPAHPVARALLVAADVPVAAPSANPYQRVSPTTAAHVIADLGDRVDVVIDGGPATVGIESTVLDVSGPVPILLRPGGLARAAIERVIGPVGTVDESQLTGSVARPSPGLVDRHYAPRARLVGFDAANGAMVWGQLAEQVGGGLAVGLLAFDVAGAAATCAIAMPRDPVGYARELYAALHELDAAGCTLAFVERLPDGDAWHAVADRLRRAGLR